MDNIKVSASRLAVWEECKWKYYAKYFLKISDPGNAKTWLGSCVHEVFELISTPLKDRSHIINHILKNKELPPSLERCYIRLLKKYKVPSVYGSKNEKLHELGKKLILNAFSYGYDFSYKVLGVEYPFDIQLTPQVRIVGFIDKISEININTLELTDYKSGQPYNYDQCQKEFQPFFYPIAASTLFSHRNRIFSFHFLKNKKTVTVVKTQRELDDFKKYIIAEGQKMLSFCEKDAIPSKSFKCKFCAMKDAREGYSGCPYFK